MLTNFVSVFGILLIAALVVLGIFFLIDRIGGMFIDHKRRKREQMAERIYADTGRYSPLMDIHSMHPSSCVSEGPFGYSYAKRAEDNRFDKLNARIANLEDHVETLEQFYYIDSDDDKSLVELYKELESKVDLNKCNISAAFDRFNHETAVLTKKQQEIEKLIYDLRSIMVELSKQESDQQKEDMDIPLKETGGDDSEFEALWDEEDEDA